MENVLLKYLFKNFIHPLDLTFAVQCCQVFRHSVATVTLDSQGFLMLKGILLLLCVHKSLNIEQMYTM